ncbi:MAG: RecQ family ATP-dependent DNA helicase [Ignavibacteriaceae bacterium]|nr:RecQ family ATP-dependent DNA helicase [Ignavibacteriaceae bacterium]
MAELSIALKENFGFDSFRDGQEEIIRSILNGRQVLAVMPTGGGKSLCYQLPALITPGVSIVVSPLIALMKDQVDNLNSTAVRAAFINSTMDFREIDYILNETAYGKYKLLYVAPERLENNLFVKRIKELSPNFLFIDEAHCISEWGHNFRPSYLKIKEFIEYCGIKKVSAFTATATPEVRKDITKQLRFSDPDIFVRGFERPNIALSVIETDKKEKILAQLLVSEPGVTIIYVSTRKTAESVSQYLTSRKVKNRYYHAGLPNIERKRIQDDFVAGRYNVIVATNAFGMGIDKKDVRMVIHYNIPGSIESFYQEYGRAGRDGAESKGVLLYDKKDIKIHHYFISNSYPDKTVIKDIYEAICDAASVAVGDKPLNPFSVNPEYVSLMLGKEIPAGMINSSLKILEDAGYLRLSYDYTGKSYLSFLISTDNLKNYLIHLPDGLKKDFLIYILRNFGAEPFGYKVRIDAEKIASELGAPVPELTGLLEDLARSGIINFSQINSNETVSLAQHRVKKDRLELDLKKVNDGYLNAHSKLSLMESYVFTGGCRAEYILRYFGENLDSYRCGKCDKCTGGSQTSQLVIDYIKKEILLSLFQVDKGLAEKYLILLLKGTTKSEKLADVSTLGSCRSYTYSEIKSVLIELKNKGLTGFHPADPEKIILLNPGLEYLEKNNFISKEDDSKPDYETDLELFHKLRILRDSAASKFSQPNYLVCNDDILKEVASVKPETKEALLTINGFNERMFNKFGAQVLELITTGTVASSSILVKNHGEIPLNLKETYKLVKDGYKLSDIAKLTNLNEAVVSMHIETLMKFDSGIDAVNLIGEEKFESIEKCYKEGKTTMKELKKELPETYTYPEIRIYLAVRKNPTGFF